MPDRRVRQSAIKVAIDARVTPGVAGGVAQAILSLVHGVGALSDGADTYSVIVESEEQAAWLQPFLGPSQRLVIKARSRESRNRERLVRALSPLRPAARRLRSLLSVGSGAWPEVPVSDGFYEALGCDVVHFPHQSFVLCALPSVYNPHDLQHLHYPQFFTPGLIAWREMVYPAGCRFARTVVVGSQWIKDDLSRQYRVVADKVQVIPEAPLTHLHPDPSADNLDEVRRTYGLERSFALYPAVTWPHKNHLRLLEALAVLRDERGLRVPLVCTGAPYDPFWPRVQARVDELNLRSQVKFLGFVPDKDLRTIYRLAEFLVLPSLFEASSLPIFDAWVEGTPVACSNAAALPDQVLDAALMFDPSRVESIADAVAKMALDGELRAALQERGHARRRDFDPQRTARAYRAVYRRAAGVELTEEEQWLLEWDWMLKTRGDTEVTVE